MYSFNYKDENGICLIPEVTGIIQEMFRNNQFKTSSATIYKEIILYFSLLYV